MMVFSQGPHYTVAYQLMKGSWTIFIYLLSYHLALICSDLVILHVLNRTRLNYACCLIFSLDFTVHWKALSTSDELLCYLVAEEWSYIYTTARRPIDSTPIERSLTRTRNATPEACGQSPLIVSLFPNRLISIPNKVTRTTMLAGSECRV